MIRAIRAIRAASGSRRPDPCADSSPLAGPGVLTGLGITSKSLHRARTMPSQGGSRSTSEGLRSRGSFHSRLGKGTCSIIHSLPSVL
jgi:hypothetical protein